MCINAVISNYLGLVRYGAHGIEMQHPGRGTAVFNTHQNVKHNWRKAVMFAIDWHPPLLYSAMEAQSFASERDGVVSTGQCFGTLREPATTRSDELRPVLLHSLAERCTGVRSLT